MMRKYKVGERHMDKIRKPRKVTIPANQTERNVMWLWNTEALKFLTAILGRCCWNMEMIVE
jgi:hypothetical protein